MARRLRLRGLGRRHLWGLGDPGSFGENIRDVLIGVGGAAGGLLIWGFLIEKAIRTLQPWAKLALAGATGVLGGTGLSYANKPLGIGLGAGLGGGAIIGAVATAMQAAQAAPTEGLRAYQYSGRYGMHGVGQMSPYAFRVNGLGRTRVVELYPGGYQTEGLGQMSPYAFPVNGLGYDPTYGWKMGRTRVVELYPGGYQTAGVGAYQYSGRYGMHGLGARPHRAFTNPLTALG